MQKIDQLAKLPSVDQVLKDPEVAFLVRDFGTRIVIQCAQTVIQKARSLLLTGEFTDYKTLINSLQEETVSTFQTNLRPLFNLTGVVLNTNLGRACLPDSAINAVIDVAANPSNLELDMNTGKRGDRNKHCENLICHLTGAKSAVVLNNNAAAVLVTLNSLARRKEVPVSRGELVEIGGSFRMPDIMKHAGCKLVEVGTTNRTYAKDFEAAVNKKTALIMKVHTSNFEIKGFTTGVSEKQLSEVAQLYSLPLVSDLGSGNLIDLKSYKLPREKTVKEVLTAGADIVTFSGDKLLGGPQAGIVAGRDDLIAKIKKNPLSRATRPDKMTLAALQAVLKLYTTPQKLAKEIPTFRFLTREVQEIRRLANYLISPVQARCPGFKVSIEPVQSQFGSGALPAAQLDSMALKITNISRTRNGKKLESLSRAFRDLQIPVIGRIAKDALWFDLRCLEDEIKFVKNMQSLKLE